VKNSSGKRRKKTLRNPVKNAFLGPKNKGKTLQIPAFFES
jgi:hypothetical protein